MPNQWTGMTTLDRFWSLIESRESCWLWRHPLKTGYGQFTADGRKVSAHRFAYEAFIGSIPEGMQIDHLCRVPRCVNPQHLEPVTAAENTHRGNAPTMIKKRERIASGTCPSGHSATRWSEAQRGCRQCAIERPVSAEETRRRAEWQAANRDQIRDRMRAWAAANREHVNRSARDRYHRRKELTP